MKLVAENLNEAYLRRFDIDVIFQKLNIDPKSVEELGEGNNGIAYKHGDKTIKITTDYEEAEFAATIAGHKLKHVANVHQIYIFDREEGDDNRNTDAFNRSRYYWVIIKDYIDHQFGFDWTYHEALQHFDNYQVKNFNYTADDFNRMIKEYEDDTIENMTEDDPSYDRYEDPELEDTIKYFELFRDLHMELQPLGIKSVCDMKPANMGMTADDYDIVYLELHIYKSGANYKEPQYKNL